MPFSPGVSGNPGGRPKGLSAAVREKYGDDGKKLIAELHKLAFHKRTDDKTKLGAIKELLDRGWGKAPQELIGDPSRPIAHRVVFGGRYRPDGKSNSTR